MPCPKYRSQIFCASPNVLIRSKNVIVFSDSSKTFVPAQKPNLLNGNHLLVCTKCLGLAQNVYQFLVPPKKFGAAQNILEPVEGQGIVVLDFRLETYIHT